MRKRKILSLFLAMVMALSLAIPALADNDGSITILYTNDIHTYIDNTREIKNEKGHKRKGGEDG